MAAKDAKPEEAIEVRRTIGLVLAVVGLAILVTCFLYTGSYRSDVFIVSVATPEADWPPGIAMFVALGAGVFGVGIGFVRPSLSHVLLVSGAAVTLLGIFEYWWNEMLVSGDGYPNLNWALTIPITVVGLILLIGGFLVRRRGRHRVDEGSNA